MKKAPKETAQKGEVVIAGAHDLNAATMRLTQRFIEGQIKSIRVMVEDKAGEKTTYTLDA